MRDEKEGRKKQARSNKQQGKATQHTQGSKFSGTCTCSTQCFRHSKSFKTFQNLMCFLVGYTTASIACLAVCTYVTSFMLTSCMYVCHFLHAHVMYVHISLPSCSRHVYVCGHGGSYMLWALPHFRLLPCTACEGECIPCSLQTNQQGNCTFLCDELLNTTQHTLRTHNYTHYVHIYTHYTHIHIYTAGLQAAGVLSN